MMVRMGESIRQKGEGGGIAPLAAILACFADPASPDAGGAELEGWAVVKAWPPMHRAEWSTRH